MRWRRRFFVRFSLPSSSTSLPPALPFFPISYRPHPLTPTPPYPHIALRTTQSQHSTPGPSVWPFFVVLPSFFSVRSMDQRVSFFVSFSPLPSKLPSLFQIRILTTCTWCVGHRRNREPFPCARNINGSFELRRRKRRRRHRLIKCSTCMPFAFLHRGLRYQAPAGVRGEV